MIRWLWCKIGWHEWIESWKMYGIVSPSHCHLECKHCGKIRKRTTNMEVGGDEREISRCNGRAIKSN